MIEINQLENALHALEQITKKLTEKQHFEVAAGLIDERKKAMFKIAEMTTEVERWVKYAEPHLNK